MPPKINRKGGRKKESQQPKKKRENRVLTDEEKQKNEEKKQKNKEKKEKKDEEKRKNGGWHRATEESSVFNKIGVKFQEEKAGCKDRTPMTRLEIMKKFWSKDMMKALLDDLNGQIIEIVGLNEFKSMSFFPLTEDKFWIWVKVWISMGLHKLDDYKDHWKTSQTDGEWSNMSPEVSNTISRDNWSYIFRAFYHLKDKTLEKWEKELQENFRKM